MSDDIQLFTTQSLDNNNLPEDKKPPTNDPDTIVFPEGSFSAPSQPVVASGFRAANIMTGNQTLPFRDDVETYTKYGVPLGNFDWEEPTEKDPKDNDGKKTIVVKVDESVYQMWQDWVKWCAEQTDYKSEPEAFEYLIIEAKNGQK